jgi:transcriptional regulator with XRE-family HTH domain
MVFGERIKQLRIEHQWTQEYVCEKLNISSGALSRYETSMYEPKSLELVKDFANLFGVSTDYLLGKTDIRNSGEQIDDVLNEAMIGMSKEQYEALTETQKKQIRDFAIFVKNQSEGDKK